MKLYALLTSVLISALLVGCMSSAPTVVEKEGSAYEVREGSMLLGNHIRVTERTVTRNVNDLLEAQVRGKNVSNKDVQFEYRFIWKNKSGKSIRSGTSVWTPLHLSAKQDGFMQAIATSPEASDFLMELRFVQDASRW